MAEVIEEEQEIPAAKLEVKKSRAGLWIGIVAILLVVALAVAGFYMLQQIRASQDSENNQDSQRLLEVDKELNGLQNQLSLMQSQVANVNAEMTGKDNHFTQTLADFSKLHQERLETQRKELDAAIGILQRQMGKTRGDWLLADAEYLLTVANQRLQLAGDVTTAREALEAADERLRESGDAAVFKVREQISKELAELSAVPAPDIVGIYSGIKQLQASVDSLSVFLPHAGKHSEHAAGGQNETAPGLLNTLAKQLDGYVVVRHTEQPVSAILTPEQADFIKQQLKVKLEMMELALVQQNDALFGSSIADARQWLKQNFAEGEQTGKFAAELDNLAALHLRAQYPDVSSSLKMLKDIGRLRIETDKAVLAQPHAPETAGTASQPVPSAPPAGQQ